jgi:hypothetical protein
MQTHHRAAQPPASRSREIPKLCRYPAVAALINTDTSAANDMHSRAALRR